MSDPTPEEREWQRAAMALRLEVVASIAADVKAKGDAAIQAAIEAERERLLPYCDHKITCPVWDDPIHSNCICGVDAAIRARGEG